MSERNGPLLTARAICRYRHDLHAKRRMLSARIITALQDLF